MKYKLFLLILIPFFCSLITYAQWSAVDSVNSAISNISTSTGKLYVCSVTTGIYISSDSGNTFIPSNNGLPNLNTRVILAKDSLLVLGTNQQIYKSTNYGSSWSLASNGFPSNGGSNVECIIFKGDSILVATYGNGIFCSLDFCQTWFTLNNGFTDLYRSCLFVNGNRLFAGTMYAGSGIYVSDNNGSSWVPKNNGVPKMWANPSKYVDITAFTEIDQAIFATTSGGNILKSVDNGESWNMLNNPNNYQWTIFTSGWTLLAGHEGVGVSRSDDLGNSWNFENDGLITLDDKDIRTFCILDSYIYTGGWSHKIFRRPVSEIVSSISENNSRIKIVVYPNPISDQSKIIIPHSFAKKYTLEIYNNEGICIKTLSGLEVNQFELQKSEFGNGIYFFRITGSEKGSFCGKFIVN